MNEKHIKLRGRPPSLDPELPGRIYKAYEMYGSVRKAAKVLGVTHPTVSKYLKERGVKVKDRITARKEQDTPVSGSFAEWIRNHPTTKLPRSIKEMSIKSGASYDAVKSFLYRRRKKIREKLNALPDLRLIPGLKIRFYGTDEIEASNIDHYEFRIDMFSGEVGIRATVNFGKGEKRKLGAEIRDLDQFIQVVNGQANKAKEASRHSDPSSETYSDA